MTDSCVVVIRFKGNEELLAILNGKLENKLKIEHPFYASISPTTGHVTMVPYCPLSDEKYFELDTSNIEFVVTASSDISTKFLAMVRTLDTPTQELEEDDEEQYLLAQVLQGNKTKH